jgi:ferredoxin
MLRPSGGPPARTDHKEQRLPSGHGIEMPQTERLRVRVDRGRCQGHARCNALAPELFRLDELGHSHEIGDGVVPPALNDKAWLAKANCPELAIDVIEE